MGGINTLAAKLFQAWPRTVDEDPNRPPVVTEASIDPLKSKVFQAGIQRVIKNSQGGYRRAQKAIDILENKLASKYGEEVVTSFDPYSAQATNIPDALFKRLAEVYKRRDAYWDFEGIFKNFKNPTKYPLGK